MKQKTKIKQTEIGMIPEEWEVKSIDEVAEVVGGGTPSTKNPEYWDGDIAWITPKDLSNFKFRYIARGERNITEKGLENSNAKLLPEGTVLLTTRAPVGYVAIAKNNVSTNQGFRSLIPRDNVKAEFLFYLLKNNIGILKSNASGTTFGELSGSRLKALRFAFPDVIEQHRIASILSSLDSKIELNQQMNKTLEEIAQAIFKRWFIDFEFPNENGEPYKSSGGEMVESELGMIPKGWDIGIFSDLCVLTMGLSPKGAFYNSSNEGYPLLNGATDFQNGVISPTKYTSKSTRLCKRGELLICVRGTIGNLTYADKEYCLGRGVASVSAKEEIFREYIFFILKEKINHLISQASGSVILGLSKPDIENIRIIVPPKNIVSDYHKISFDIFLEKSLVTEENTKLSKIRDLLLPKLMTGKIRVPLEEQNVQ